MLNRVQPEKIDMRTRLALVIGLALLAAGTAFTSVSGQAARKTAASMVVYKSPT
jgi:hypothetical protein